MSTTTRTLRVSSRLRRDILLMATCGSFALLSGCQENADLANSQKAAEELQKISKEYTNELADLTHDSDINQVASRLEGFARSARSVSGTTAEQKKTATTLSATIASAAGGLRATEFTQIELDQMARRNMIATRTSSAMIIAAGAIERSDTSFTEAGNGMAMERESLKVQSEEISQRLSEHQANAAQLRQQQQRTSQQLDQMTLDAARLGRQAKDSGPIEAYPLIEESAEIRSRMIPVKAKVADAETRLALIEPQVESTNTERTNIASMIEATIRAERNIALMAEAVTAAGDAGKQRAATETREVERLLAEYMAVEKDAASPVFESALSNLEQAQRSGSSKGAKALASGASRMIGDLQAMRANGALAEARLFTALASAAEMTGISADEWNAMAASAMEVQETAREAARTAYQDALDKLASAGGIGSHPAEDRTTDERARRCSNRERLVRDRTPSHERTGIRPHGDARCERSRHRFGIHGDGLTRIRHSRGPARGTGEHPERFSRWNTPPRGHARHHGHDVSRKSPGADAESTGDAEHPLIPLHRGTRGREHRREDRRRAERLR